MITYFNLLPQANNMKTIALQNKPRLKRDLLIGTLSYCVLADFMVV